MNRILGFDLGSKTLGVAVSDPLGMIARALKMCIRDRAVTGD